MIRLLIVLIFTLMLTVGAERALAEGKRVALVIGVSAYQTVARLPNAVNDSGAMADLFRKAGFDVVTARTDVNNLEFKRSIREFEDSVADADIAVVFYAGHGIEIRDVNYLIPTDAKLLNERDAEDEAITLDRLITAIEPAKRLRLIILDACRDNPFTSKMKRRVATRAVTAGLGKVEPAMSDTLIAYAAKDKAVAADGDGEHSPYTMALLKNLTEPGLDIRLAFGRVRDDVMRATGRKQEPYVYGSLGGGTMALVPAPAAAVQAVPAVAGIRPDQGSKTDYEIVERVGKREAWEVFLNTHKTGLYADLARVQLAKLSETAGVGRTAVPGALPGGGVKVAPNVEAPGVAPASKPSAEEQRAWDRLKVSSDRTGIKKFLERYPTSPLAPAAQELVDRLDHLAREREHAARTEREAALQREEEDKRKKAAEVERKRLEREAAKHREAEDRAKSAELERQKAEAQATVRQREAEDRARAAEALARQRAADEQIRAAAAERQRLEAQAAKQRAEEQLKAAEAERQNLQAEAVARRQQAEETARTAPDQQPDRGESTKPVLEAEAERLRIDRDAVAARREVEKAAEAKRQAAAEVRRRAAEAARAAAELRAEREAAAERRAAAEAAATSRRNAAEAARAAAERRAEREVAAERRAAAEEARRRADSAAAAGSRRAAEASKRAAERQAERSQAAAEARRREARVAKEAAQARIARPRPAPQQARPEAVAARPAPRASGSSGASSMVGIGF